MVEKKQRNRRFSILAALRFGFYTIIEHFAFYIALMLSYVGILASSLAITLFFICLPFYTQMMHLARILESAGLSRYELIKNIIKQLGQPMIFALVLGGIIMYLIFRLLNLGMTKIALEFYDYDDSSIKTLFAPWRLIFRDMIASAIYAVMCGLGFILIVPGIYFMLTFGFYHQFIVDQNLSILDAFRQSKVITYGAKWHLFALFLLIMFIRWIALSIFGVTLLIIIPLVSLIDVYVYRKLLEYRLR